MASDVNQRIIARMRGRIGEYEAGTLSLGRLADDLEGSISALDPSLMAEAERQFFDLFSVLDVAVATDEEERYKALIGEALRKIDSFLAELG